MANSLNLLEVAKTLTLAVIGIAWTILGYTRVINPCIEAKSAYLPIIGGLSAVIWVVGIAFIARHGIRSARKMVDIEVVDSPIKLDDKHFKKEDN